MPNWYPRTRNTITPAIARRARVGLSWCRHMTLTLVGDAVGVAVGAGSTAYVAGVLDAIGVAVRGQDVRAGTERVTRLDAIAGIMKGFPGVHTTCGLTNVSHGLPNRKLVNRTFLISAIARGLDCAILDPTDKPLYGSLKAAQMIMGKVDFCMEYIKAVRDGRLE